MMENKLEELAFNERPDYQELLAIAKGMDSNFKQQIASKEQDRKYPALFYPHILFLIYDIWG